MLRREFDRKQRNIKTGAFGLVWSPGRVREVLPKPAHD